jgi:hypothetical protein
MRTLLVLALLLFSISFYLPAQAQPPLWQPDFGDELPVVSDCDDCEEAINLPFSFPFNGSSFDMAYVGSNGCIQLGGLGLDGIIYYDYWSTMEDFLADSDPDNPLICPFEADLDTEDESSGCGTIYYNDSGNPLIITWDEVCSHNDDIIQITSQILLYEDGRIVLNFNGIGVGEDLENLDGGIVVGVTPSDFPFDDEDFVPGDPGPVNLNQGPFNFGTTAYERWCYDAANSCGVNGSDTELPGPINTAFDLDFWSICFDPADDGFSITSGFEGNIGFDCEEVVAAGVPALSEWGLISMAGILGIVGFMVMRRRKVTA